MSDTTLFALQRTHTPARNTRNIPTEGEAFGIRRYVRCQARCEGGNPGGKGQEGASREQASDRRMSELVRLRGESLTII